MFLLKVIFWISAFIIVWAMIGYNISLKILGKIYKNRKIYKDYQYEPEVTVMVVAHNEEKVILQKLKNITSLDYPINKIKYIIASDNSTDLTNMIAREFITENPDLDILLYEVKERKGKINAQNEAQKHVKTSILVLTDANAMLKANAVKELVSCFKDEKVMYVAGQLIYTNSETSDASNMENSYWSQDMKMREIESRIQTITAGNGALYACRNDEYYEFDLIESHDIAMPLYYGLKGYRAICNVQATAYEKAGQSIEDEFKRKVRMNRAILKYICPDIRLFNFAKCKWFTYFYFGHRSCRYLLWLMHMTLIISNILMTVNDDNYFYTVTLGCQITFFILAFIRRICGKGNKLLNISYYYCMTILAQWVGVYNILTGKVKPFWEKAETTR